MPTVAVIAYDQISPFHLAAPCVVFGESHPGAPRFELRVCSFERGPLRTTAGFDIAPAHGLEALLHAEVVIVPGWRDPAELPPLALRRALQAAHGRGAQIVGLCLGAYVVGAAGLLDGRSATTHWAYASDFAERFPAIRVDAKVLYVDEGDVVTSAGTAAGIDCCLHLLRQSHGASAANQVARRLVMPPHREGGQAQYIDLPLPSTARDARLAALLGEVRERLHEPLTLDRLARQAAMSRRNFTRRFRELTGASFQRWLLAERLRLTQRLLEETDQPVERVADLAGFGSAVSLRQHFRAAFGVSPSAWRRTFAGAARPP